MYDMPNHRERRRIAKQLGLLKSRSKLSFKKWCEEITRSISAGQEIHRVKTEQMLRDLEAQESAVSEAADELKINPKKDKILQALTVLGEKRSYCEIAADIELSIWNNRYGKIKTTEISGI
jgi:hypothetical protein